MRPLARVVAVAFLLLSAVLLFWSLTDRSAGPGGQKGGLATGTDGPAIAAIGQTAGTGAAAAAVDTPAAVAGEPANVIRVVDGDTLEVLLPSGRDKVRLIGVDTPETVHPNRPVERYGKEATAFTRRMVLGKAVRLEGEAGQPDRDRYQRLLRYVHLEDGTCLNVEIIRQGFGFAYVKFPFARMEEFRGYEREARQAGRGLWAGKDDSQAGR